MSGGFEINIAFDPRPLEGFKAGASTSTILGAAARAASKAGGDAIRKVRVESSRIIRAKKRLKVKQVNRGLPTSRYGSIRSIASLRWEMRVSGAHIPISAYPVRQTSKGVSVEVNVGRRKLIKHAFIANVGSFRGAFVRKGAARLPIKTLYSSTMADVFRDADVKDRVTLFARSTFTANYMRLFPLELSRLLVR